MRYLVLLAALVFTSTAFSVASNEEEISEQIIRIVAISDTHARHRELRMPEGDILIHAGDFSNYGKRADIIDFNAWLGELNYERIFVVAGNHENPRIIKEAVANLLTNATFLERESICYRGINIYGFGWAFNGEMWRWPKNMHIVITHQAPTGVMGGTSPQPGCNNIAQAIIEHPPLLHIFGHHHSEFGLQSVTLPTNDVVLFANAASSGSKTMNKPMVFEARIKGIEVIEIKRLTE